MTVYPLPGPCLCPPPSRALAHKVSNIDIMTFETSCNVATNTRAWNKRTQGWLERYVYMRTGTGFSYRFVWLCYAAFVFFRAAVVVWFDRGFE